MCYNMAAYYLPQNAGDIARKYIKDPQLLSFIDAEVDEKTYSIHLLFNLLAHDCNFHS